MVLPRNYPELDSRIKLDLSRIRSAQGIFENVKSSCHVERWNDVLKATSVLYRRLGLYSPQWAMYSRTWSTNEKLLMAAGLWDELREVRHKLKALQDCLFDEIMQRKAKYQMEQQHTGDELESPVGDDAYNNMAGALSDVEDLLALVRDDGPLDERAFDVEVAYISARH